MCICAYTYTYTRTHTYKHTHTHTRVAHAAMCIWFHHKTSTTTFGLIYTYLCIFIPLHLFLSFLPEAPSGTSVYFCNLSF